MIVAIRNFMSDTKGVTLIEYGLIAALISVFLVTVLGNIGTNLSKTFSAVASKV